MPAKPEYSWAWQEKSKDNLVRLDEGDIPRNLKNLYCWDHKDLVVSHTRIIRKNSLVGDKVYLHKIYDQVSLLKLETKMMLILLAMI